MNVEHKLTVDDVIVEYMMYKIKNGYEPKFLASEFIEFLKTLNGKIEVEDPTYEKDKLFPRFFERKLEKEWRNGPHMNMKSIEEKDDFVIEANYKFSIYDESVINTYFMKYNDKKERVTELREAIGKFLSNEPKRKIDTTIEVDKNAEIIGKYTAAEIISNIWESYIATKIENHQWPRQCRDMNTYLLETDLAVIIGLPSIKKTLLDLYCILAKRIAILYFQDKNLRISSYKNGFLERANYELLIEGYEDTIGIAFGKFKKSLHIDLENLTLAESHEKEGIYFEDEDPEIKTTTTAIKDNSVKRLVRNLEKNK